MTSKSFIILAALCVTAAVSSQTGSGVAAVTVLQGTAQILRSGGDSWRKVRPNMTLSIGDQLYTGDESFLELHYRTGAILRMNEKTKIVISAADDNSSSTRSGVGDVWVNMQKLVVVGKRFDLSTPTVTAAIRGTVFHASTSQDSSTDVAVYDGTVAVGPNKKQNEDSPEKNTDPGTRSEIPGPEEIPGPYEVTLDEWNSIVAGQIISVRADGKYSKSSFNPADAAKKDDFVKRNMLMDEELAKSRKK